MVDHRAVDAIVDAKRVEHQRRRDFGRRVDEAIVVLEPVVGLIRGARVAVDDVPARRHGDVESNRIGLVVDDVHEQRRSVPIRVRRIEHAECARQRVRVDAIAHRERARTAWIDAPERSVLPIPAQRGAAAGDGELRDVSCEVERRVAARRPDGHLQLHDVARDFADVDLNVVHVSGWIAPADAIGDVASDSPKLRRSRASSDVLGTADEP